MYIYSKAQQSNFYVGIFYVYVFKVNRINYLQLKPLLRFQGSKVPS